MLLDTSAWVEFFTGEDKGRKVKNVLLEEKCYTSIVSLAEISNWAMKKGRDPKRFLDIIDSLSETINLSREACILAGELNFKRKQETKKWGMMDSFILATALLYGFTILTADSDFRDLENATLL